MWTVSLIFTYTMCLRSCRPDAWW